MRITGSSVTIHEGNAEVTVTVDHEWSLKAIGEARIRPIQSGRPGVLGGVLVEFLMPGTDSGQPTE